MLSELRRIVTLPECIAVGEIGIDMATACDCRQPYSRSACRMALLYSQMDLLYVLLVLSMETKKAVVLRCWEWLNLCCRRSRCLMEGHLYHWNCYTGSVSEAEEWLASLPSFIFGISPKLFTERNVQDVARFIPLERMVLEMESPYLAEYPMETVGVVSEVAKLRTWRIYCQECGTPLRTLFFLLIHFPMWKFTDYKYLDVNVFCKYFMYILFWNLLV